MVENSSTDPSDLVLLTPDEMGMADRAAIEAGTPGIRLMEQAGMAVAKAAAKMCKAGASITVLAGPGNNGGDGFVAARILSKARYRVRVFLLGERARLKGDAATAAERWAGPTVSLDDRFDPNADLLIDALFGAGLTKPLAGVAAHAAAAVGETEIPVLAVDLPSGVNGETGACSGQVFRASRTVTFFRLKPGHVLLPGREMCGDISVADIGIPGSVLSTVGARLWRNRPALWAGARAPHRLDGHKYNRGHVVVVSGPAARTGAARLAAAGAARGGAGLVTIAAPGDALPDHGAHLTSTMMARIENARELGSLLTDPRYRAVVVGPANGVGAPTRELTVACLKSAASVILDADAMTSFDGTPHALFDLLLARSEATIMTPHSGEFGRLFPDLVGNPDKVARARGAARRSGAVVVLKGGDTVVASPDERASVADNAPPWLATAGSGDVLAGTIAGLRGTGMAAFEAACSGVWLHGQAAQLCGEGLIAEDLPDAYPLVYRTREWLERPNPARTQNS